MSIQLSQIIIYLSCFIAGWVFGLFIPNKKVSISIDTELFERITLPIFAGGALTIIWFILNLASIAFDTTVDPTINGGFMTFVVALFAEGAINNKNKK